LNILLPTLKIESAVRTQSVIIKMISTRDFSVAVVVVEENMIPFAARTTILTIFHLKVNNSENGDMKEGFTMHAICDYFEIEMVSIEFPKREK
jgi:hypothetical protein